MFEGVLSPKLGFLMGKFFSTHFRLLDPKPEKKWRLAPQPPFGGVFRAKSCVAWRNVAHFAIFSRVAAQKTRLPTPKVKIVGNFPMVPPTEKVEKSKILKIIFLMKFDRK